VYEGNRAKGAPLSIQLLLLPLHATCLSTEGTAMLSNPTAGDALRSASTEKSVSVESFRIVVACYNAPIAPFRNERSRFGVIALAKAITETVDHGLLLGFLVINAAAASDSNIVTGSFNPFSQILRHVSCSSTRNQKSTRQDIIQQWRKR